MAASRSSYYENLQGLSSNSSSPSDLLNYMTSNLNGSTGSVSNGGAISTADLASYWYDYATTQDERSYNEWYYNTYESPSAMVSQYQEAGLNPALMYGSGDSTTSTNVSGGYDSNAPSGHAPTMSLTNKFEKTMSILGFLGQMASLGSQMKLNKAQARDTNAQAARTEHDLKNEIDVENSREKLLDGSYGDSFRTKEFWQNRILSMEFWNKVTQNRAGEFEADIKGFQRDWMQELYTDGLNLYRKDYDAKELDVKIKQFESDWNDFISENGYFRKKWHKFENEITQSDYETLLGDPDSSMYWVNKVLGFIGSVFGFSFSKKL